MRAAEGGPDRLGLVSVQARDAAPSQRLHEPLVEALGQLGVAGLGQTDRQRGVFRGQPVGRLVQLEAGPAAFRALHHPPGVPADAAQDEMSVGVLRIESDGLTAASDGLSCFPVGIQRPAQANARVGIRRIESDRSTAASNGVVQLPL